jgi:hypothetical protein
MFTGKNIGKKIARGWSMGLKKLHAPCVVCRVECGNQDDLNRHMANKHSKAKKEETA